MSESALSLRSNRVLRSAGSAEQTQLKLPTNQQTIFISGDGDGFIFANGTIEK